MTIKQAASSSAQRVGSDLQAARERLGWSLPETSAYVRIRLPFLQALEEGRVAALPGHAYALGFIRTYARALGMDSEELVRRYRDEVGVAVPKTELNFPTPLPQRHVPAGAVVLLGSMLAVVGYVGWYRVSGNQSGPVPVQQVPARLAPLALPVVPPPPAHVAAIVPKRPVETVTRDYGSPSAAEASVPTPGSLIPIDPAPAVATATAQLVLNATADAWVQVKDGSGKIVLSKLMHAGDRWPVPDQPAGAPPMLLTTGNAGGTELTLDGQALPPLGASGAVRRDIELTR